ncbi:MAG: hypothetical protein DMD71_04590 [Gemmatimonadetes bacterium]|nr:MAG: hypothetical protein DMD71_04590 [Gemmatimonadota bacterium]PYO85626.1 MAG: hypothetical protein DMD68_03145 [Gemmatimonadota bacterium]
MSEPAPSPQKDPFAIGLGALATGAGLGGGVATLAQGVVAILRDRVDPEYYQFVGADPLLAGLVAGIVVAALFGWRRSTPLENLWQSGVIGVLSAVGAILIGFLAAVADRLLGLAGIVAWGLASVTCGVLGSRWAVRAASAGIQEPESTP